MHGMNRREFMRQSAVAAAAAVAGNSIAHGTAAAESTLGELRATTMRTLGNTGLKTTLVGMGTGVKSWNGESELTRKGDEAFYELLRYAYDQGIRYFDLADMYGSHSYMNKMLKTHIDRSKVLLLTKTVSREGDMVKADIERFRRELDTDQLDIVLMHCLTKPGWTTDLQPCMDALADAKAKGKIRAHGVSCHNFECMVEAAEEPWTDVMLSRINPFQVKMDGPPEEVAAVLKKACDNGKGMLGMKIVGEGQLADKVSESLKYVLGLGCIHAMPIGFLDKKEVDDIARRIEEVA